jgi:hypothetical protein
MDKDLNQDLEQNSNQCLDQEIQTLENGLQILNANLSNTQNEINLIKEKYEELNVHMDGHKATEKLIKRNIELREKKIAALKKTKNHINDLEQRGLSTAENVLVAKHLTEELRGCWPSIMRITEEQFQTLYLEQITQSITYLKTIYSNIVLRKLRFNGWKDCHTSAPLLFYDYTFDTQFKHQLVIPDFNVLRHK